MENALLKKACSTTRPNEELICIQSKIATTNGKNFTVGLKALMAFLFALYL